MINEYILEIALAFAPPISIKVKAENSEMALNQVKGMCQTSSGWVDFLNISDTPCAVRESSIVGILVMEKVNDK